MPEKKFYSPREAAEVLSVSSATIARRLRDGTIQHVKLGSRVLIPSSFFDSLMVSANVPKAR
jgi:excisionase family DNA binding protein